jgi:hypothetical protein
MIAVARLARIGGLKNRLNGGFKVAFVQNNVDLNFGQEIDLIGSGPPDQLNASLPAVPPDFKQTEPTMPIALRPSITSFTLSSRIIASIFFSIVISPISDDEFYNFLKSCGSGV